MISYLDYSIIVCYFAIIFLIAYRITIREKARSVGKESTGYFLAGRNMGWFLIGASIFASNIGTEHLIGLAGSGARGDMLVAQFELLLFQYS